MKLTVKPLSMGYLVEYEEKKHNGIVIVKRAVSDRKALVLVLGSLMVKEVNLSKNETICNVERG